MSKRMIKSYIRCYYQKLYSGENRCHLLGAKGKHLAKKLGYPDSAIDELPEYVWEYFYPCGNPFPLLRSVATGRGLNLGCGIAVDSYVILQVTRSVRQVINLDIIEKVLKKSRCSLIHSTSNRFQWCCGDADKLPFRAGSFDWVLMNGVFNLFSDKRALLLEARRVLRRGGSIVVCDLFLQSHLPPYFQEELDAWAWCMNGAVSRKRLIDLLNSTGFRLLEYRCEERIDWFLRSSFLAAK